MEFREVEGLRAVLATDRDATRGRDIGPFAGLETLGALEGALVCDADDAHVTTPVSSPDLER
jgi:hypothetical protein